MKFVEDIIIRPLITEKSMDMISQKKYSFEVAKDATKPEIAKAVEKMFEGTKGSLRQYRQHEGKDQKSPLC